MLYKLAVIASAAALVSACSSSGGSTTGSNGKKLTTLTVNAAFFGPVDVPLMYAEMKDYYADQGLDLKFVTASSNTQLAAVLGGSVQFASTSTLNIVKAAKNGAKFVNFMPIEIGYSEDVIMSKGAYAAAGLNASATTKDKIAALADKKAGRHQCNR
jgi:ABC-type nitrate/sulfonate/bicarbonate transport system substrate-binding protein